jgi:hypothetical protein
MRRLLLMSSLFILVSAISVSAQTLVINPTTATFTASPDHAVIENTVPLVTNYELRVFLSTNTTTPVRVVNLNKPTPDASNLISVSVVSTIAALAPGDYFGRVAAIGPGGEGVSVNSNPFQVKPRAPGAPINLLFIK